MRQGKSAADIGDIDCQPITDIGDIAAIIRDHAVHEQYLSTQRDETPGDRGADQAQSTGNHRPSAGTSARRRGVIRRAVCIPRTSGGSPPNY
jgi:hypothetical protein